MFRAVIDTNVLVAGLKSSVGNSFRLLETIVVGQLQPALTTPLVFEYEAVLHRAGLLPATLSSNDITKFLDWLVHVSSRHRVHYLWRPLLPDPHDDLVLEAALASDCRHIITFNLNDFRGAADLGVVALTPFQFLKHLQP